MKNTTNKITNNFHKLTITFYKLTNNFHQLTFNFQSMGTKINVGKDSYMCLFLPNIYMNLAIAIHRGIVLFVSSACDTIHPFLVFKIPFYGLLNTFFELERGFPT